MIVTTSMPPVDVPESLSEPDGVEHLDHRRSADELCAGMTFTQTSDCWISSSIYRERRAAGGAGALRLAVS